MKWIKLSLITLVASFLLLSGFYYFKGSFLWFLGRFDVPTEQNAKIYVISLDRTPERFQKLKTYLDNAGIEAERFSAVDGYNIDIINTSDNSSFKGIDIKNKTASFKEGVKYQVICSKEPLISYQYHYDPKVLKRPLTAGELGCTCSHLSLWHKVANSSDKKALILEDDIIAQTPHFKNYLFYAISQIPNDLSITYMTILRKKVIENNLVYNIFNLNNILWKIHKTRALDGALAYVISPSSAKYLVEQSQAFHLPVDNHMQHVIRRKGLEGYMIFFPLITHDDNATSSIDSMQPGRIDIKDK